MNEISTRRAALPTVDEPLPSSASQRGLALLRSWEACLKAMNDPNDRRMIEAARSDLRASLTPAKPAEVAQLIEELMIMHPATGKTEADNRVMARAWLTDLAEYPADAIEAACVQWRRNDNPFMPKPGQLMALIDPIVNHRKRLLRRADDVIAEHEREPRPQTRPEPVRSEPDPDIAAGLEDLIAKCKPGSE